ncbi:MAG: type II secretion system F family protein [Deltaproteobacteria bacterium]|nr:type II secretion system F family protein [Deltaproteobacteria bacterium]
MEQQYGARTAATGAMMAFRKTLIAFLAAIIDKSAPQQTLEGIRVKLRKAGMPYELRASELVAFQIVSGAVFLGLGALVAFWLDYPFLVGENGLDLTGTAVMLVTALLGFLYPLLWLNDRVRIRHHLITRALPYNLDLLTLSVEAGLDFAAAIGKVVEKGRKGPLADELSITLRELKLGKTREEGLRNLAARVDLGTLTTFVNALIQADKMGTPLGKILRIMSTQMRIERTQRAEKLANEAPVKMLFPLIGFIFPTIFLILFGPIVYQVMHGS